MKFAQRTEKSVFCKERSRISERVRCARIECTLYFDAGLTITGAADAALTLVNAVRVGG